MDDSSNQFRQSATPPVGQPLVDSTEPDQPSTDRSLSGGAAPAGGANLSRPETFSRWTTALILSLGVLLIVGGIYLGLRRSPSGEVVSLPDFIPSTASTIAPTPTALTASASSPSITDRDTAKVSPRPSLPQATQAPRAITAATTSPRPRVASRITRPETKAASSNLPTTPPTPSPALPDYQPAVVLADYQPQYVGTSSPVTIRMINLKVGTREYSLEPRAGMTVIGLLDAAASQGLTYKTRQTSFGPMIIELNGEAGDWVYTVNRQCVNLGAHQQLVYGGDTVNWKRPGASIDCS